MILLDGVSYNCDISIDRSVALKERYRVTTKDNLSHRKLSGVKHTASVTFSATKDRAAYEALFAVLVSETAYHELTVPWGSNTLTMSVMVTSVSDTMLLTDSGGHLFSGMKITFEER